MTDKNLSPNPNEAQQGLEALLASQKRGPLRRWLPWLAGLAVLLFAVWRFSGQSAVETSSYVTQPLERGDLVAIVTATGNLEPTHQVTVGSELSGVVDQVLVEENDQVQKGQILAVLDTSKLAEQTERTRAALNTARAQVQQTEATVTETRANLHRLEELLRRSEGLLVSQADLDASRAQAARAEAALASMRAAQAEAESALRANETDLVKGVIRSPIDGLVLERNIEPGQTVAASFQAPILFTLAENLRTMKLEVGVAEADVAKVASDNRASFTVDAWPGQSFEARVIKVKFGSKVVENVVTYGAELEVDNSDLRLRPGMTATADIRVAERHDVLLAPNAALRFAPPEVAKKSKGFSMMPRPPVQARTVTSDTPRLFVLRNQQPVEVAVTTGLSDGKKTEVVGEGLKPGDAVILEMTEGAS